MRAPTSVILTFAVACGSLMVSENSASANPLAGNGYSSSYVGESVFQNKGPGESGQFTAIFFNDGTEPWVPGIVGLFVCLPDKLICNVPSPNAAYASGWYSSSVYATVTSIVAPGQTGFFMYGFTVPAGTPGETTATFNGDVGLIQTGRELRPQGYFHRNTTPAVPATLSISTTSSSLPIGGQLQFTATTTLTSAVTWSVTGGCGVISVTGVLTATTASQPCSVVAQVGSLTASASIVVFGPAASLTCVAVPSTISANGGGANGTSALTIGVRDANGNPVVSGTTSVTVTNGTPSLATVSPTGSAMTTGGVLGVTVTSTTTAGQITVSASSSGITGCSVVITSS